MFGDIYSMYRAYFPQRLSDRPGCLISYSIASRTYYKKKKGLSAPCRS